MRARRYRPTRGFTLIELLVALAVFAALAAAAYGGLAAVADTRAALARQQDRFSAVTRSIGIVERDVRQALSRSVRSQSGALLPAVDGRGDALELTRLGFANPRGEPRSNLQRVSLALDGRTLRHGSYAVLDRAPGTLPATSVLLDGVQRLQLRYLGDDHSWRERWPPDGAAPDALPRAIELRLTLSDLGELRRIVELPGSWPPPAVAAP
ncbi:type II secretion system minor pseudopilin GspJ [Dokdonella sp.]|uniref:type II secretion system minor pseudopilin GspJ n=1 Tax=Dokdonella sp. TaxID=2291710 RepID=UPI0031BF810B|nr:type II secretion system minor pseudopilin GspJ [Dokdonella sp.]